MAEPTHGASADEAEAKDADEGGCTDENNDCDCGGIATVEKADVLLDSNGVDRK